MTHTLDDATIRRIARLSRIRVTDADVVRLGAELGGILGWIEQLDEVDVAGVEPLAGVVPTALRLREDVVSDGGYAERVLANATGAEGGFFTVPKVVE